MMEEPEYLYEDDSIKEWSNFLKQTGHSRFPVLNRAGEIVGVLTPKIYRRLCQVLLDNI